MKHPYPIIRGPDPRLNQVCEPFDWATDIDLLNEIVETMRAHPRAIGLAAPQIGIMRRFVAIRPKMQIGHPEISVMVNPKIIKSSGICNTAEEECMSFPWIKVKISRPNSTRISFELGPGQGTAEVSFMGLAARCVLHEIEHLQGITIENHKKRAITLK